MVPPYTNMAVFFTTVGSLTFGKKIGINEFLIKKLVIRLFWGIFFRVVAYFVCDICICGCGLSGLPLV